MTPPPPRPDPSAGEPDPLSRLHKMSTTAGLGSGDYVAVNGTAVAALLLGLASMLVLLEEFLLFIPVAAIVVSIIAWRQIRDSNGTQTGQGLIAVALVFALSFGGFVVTRETTRGLRTRDDRAAIARLFTDIGDRTKAGDYDGLYAMFSDRFHERFTRADLEQRLAAIRQSEQYGMLKNTTWNGLAEIDTDPATGTRYAMAKLDFNVEKAERPIPVNVSLRKTAEGVWVIDGMPEIFQVDPRRPPGQAPGQTPGQAPGQPPAQPQ